MTFRVNNEVLDQVQALREGVAKIADQMHVVHSEMTEVRELLADHLRRIELNASA